MSRIIILDEKTAGQIAAGEVVERPVSVVKELVENSLDAGANQVAIEISEGGKSGITVYDNGHGMSQEEVNLAFCRHATSKISSVRDLYNLSTLGFRGEALPSIAAVSHMMLKTKVPGEAEGYSAEVKGGEFLSLQPVGCSPGTSVRVKDLFFNTPARRKHLKSTGTEAGLVTSLVQNMALTRPGVRFLMKHNERVVFQTSGTDRVIDSVSAVYGVRTAREMVEFNGCQGNIKLTGFISKPSINRATRSYITVAINGRYVRNKSINKAIDEAYSGLVPSGRHPIVILNIDLSQSELDVNIHPAKMEVRFDREMEVVKFIKETIRYRLKNEVLIPTYERRDAAKNKHIPKQNNSGTKCSRNNVTDKFIDGILPVHGGYGFEKQQGKYKRNISEPMSEVSVLEPQNKDACCARESSPDYNFNTITAQGDEKKTVPVPGYPQTGKNEQLLTTSKGSSAKQSGFDNEISFPFLQVIGQLLPTYIISAGPGGLYILDQHAAHERIIFEKLLLLQQSDKKETQILLTPVPLELDYKLLEILRENLGNLKALGFVIEEFGIDTYVMRGVPTLLSTFKGVRDLTDLLEEISMMKKEKDFNLAFITRMACRAAIKSGEVLSLNIMEVIVNQLSRTNEPYTCPHGRPTLVKISEKELTQMFKRTN